MEVGYGWSGSGDSVLLAWLRKNAIALKEINSNEESNADGMQLLMLLPNETHPLQRTRLPIP